MNSIYERHITTYAKLLIMQKMLNIPYKILHTYMEHILNGKVPFHMFDNFLKDKPKTKNLVHGLRLLGFQPTHIASILSITPSQVSVHLRTEPKKHYFSRALWHIEVSISKENDSEYTFI